MMDSRDFDLLEGQAHMLLSSHDGLSARSAWVKHVSLRVLETLLRLVDCAESAWHIAKG